MAPPSLARSRSSVPGPVVLKSTSGTVSLPDIHRPKLQTSPSMGIYGRQWTTENRRLLHEFRERSWLIQQGKHAMVDFSEKERKELRAYFEAIAEVETNGKKQRRIRVDRLEDMLISLGLAGNRREVGEIVRAIDDRGSGELDFEQYLTIVRTIAEPAIFQVFKAMIDGKLGDRNLNFRTVISGYRRGMIMDATGARSQAPRGCDLEQDPSKKQEMEAAKKRGKRILDNFANLQKGRYDRGEKRGDRGETGEDLMPFDGSGFVPTGGMQMLWNTVCREHNLVPSRPSSAEKRSLEPPRSPSDIIHSIVSGSTKRKTGRGTVIIGAPQQVPSRPTTQEGNREIRAQLSTG